MDKPHILASAAEADFCDLKSKFSLELKKSNSGGSVRKEDLSSDTTFGPCKQIFS